MGSNALLELSRGPSNSVGEPSGNLRGDAHSAKTHANGKKEEAETDDDKRRLLVVEADSATRRGEGLSMTTTTTKTTNAPRCEEKDHEDGGAPTDVARPVQAARSEWRELLASSSEERRGRRLKTHPTQTKGTPGGGGQAGESIDEAATAPDAQHARDRLLSWDQDTTAVYVRVAVPSGTRARDVGVDVRPDRMTFSLAWHGAVKEASGKLRGRCVASETLWTLEDGDAPAASAAAQTDGAGDRTNRSQRRLSHVHVVLTKRDRGLTDAAWTGLFEGDEEKSLTDVLRELTHADEASARHEDLPQDVQAAIEEVRERRMMMGSGEWNPLDGTFDDFRLVLRP